MRTARESVATPHPGSMIQHRDQSLRDPRRDSAQRSSSLCLSLSPDNRSIESLTNDRFLANREFRSESLKGNKRNKCDRRKLYRSTISSHLRASEIDRPSRSFVESCQEEDLSVFMDSLVIRVERTDHVLNHNFAI